MDNRQYLQKDSKIFLVRVNEKNNYPTEFTIKKLIGAGSSCICYSAVCGGIDGTLKEYYPLSQKIKNYTFDFDRKKSEFSELDGQLYSKPSTIDNLISARKEYEDICNRANEAKSKKPDLKNFLPAAELFRSFTGNDKIINNEAEDPENNYTYYTWVAGDPEMESFGDCLKKICSDTENGINAEKNIALLLNCFIELAKGIDLLHNYPPMYHLDISANNFGVKTYMNEANRNVSISLYDTNTLFSRGKTGYPSAGTPYFRSPEVRSGMIDKYGIQSDVFSIGAVMYYAFVIGTEKDENGHKTYINKFFRGGEDGETAFSDIARDLKNSELFRINDDVGNVILNNMLYKVIAKALNRCGNSVGTYATAEELARDLEEILNKFSVEISKKSFNQIGEYFLETKLTAKEQHWDKNISSGAAGAIMLHLYKYPLYKYKPENSDKINILVLGGGTYASKFTDLAFEMSQIKNCYADITIASNAIDEDRENYLLTRSEIVNFFSLDGNKPAKTEESFGNLNFCTADLGYSGDRKTLNELLSQKNYSYVFIALNDEMLNYKTARLTAECVSEIPQSEKAFISYVSYGSKGTDIITSDFSEKAELVPLNIFDTLETSSEYETLKRMAFNVHLIWTPDGIADLGTAEKSFSEDYNFINSLKNALSVKYKLASVGIDMDADDLNSTAEQIRNKLEDSLTKNELIMYEHRRWIVSLIVDSWKTLEEKDFNSLVSATKNSRDRLHPCLVSSGSSNELSSPRWTENGLRRWNTADDSELDSLDDLDRMSVKLHRHFSKLAKALNKNRAELNSKIMLLKKEVQSSKRLSNLFGIYNASLNALLSENAGRETVRKYNCHASAFCHELNKHKNKEKAKALFEDIDKILFPVKEADSYVDWKAKDFDLISSIPFILTYSSSLRLCIPMVIPDDRKFNVNTAFANVASPLRLNPAVLTYIVDADITAKDFSSFESTVKYISDIFTNHGLQTKIDLILFEKTTSGLNIDINVIKGISERINIVREIVYLDFDAISKFREMLISCSPQKANGNGFSAIEYNNTKMSGFIQAANVSCSGTGCTVIPFFTFDGRTQKFTCSDGCSYLSYVNNRPHLNVEDLFNAKGKNITFFEPEIQADYQFFWELYRECPTVWKSLCKNLRSICGSELAYIDLSKLSKNIISSAEFILPSFCEDAVEKIITHRSLKSLNVIPDYELSFRTSKSLLLTVRNVSETVVEFLTKLLSNPEKLIEPSLVSINETNSLVFVVYRSMSVPYFPVSGTEGEKTVSFLKRMKKNLYLTALSFTKDDTGKVTAADFSFSSLHVMELLTDEEKLYRLYAYYRMLESGIFDDVRSNVKLVWDENSGAADELDIVATRGFNTVILDATTSNELDKSFYSNLSNIGNLFGINNITVLLADINQELSLNNQSRKAFGDNLGVHTICKADSFIDDVKKLLKN